MTTKTQPIRILIIEDSPTESFIIKEALSSSPDLEVVGVAANGKEGLELLLKTRPDIVCTDYFMPVMDGLEFIKHAVQVYPCPILVLSIGVQSYQSDNIFKMLSAGAIDIMPKPLKNEARESINVFKRLVEKIKTLAQIKYQARSSTATLSTTDFCRASPTNLPEIIGIGASTGGPQALEKIIPNLPKDFPLPVVCVQHISPGFVERMVDWLNKASKVAVELAISGDRPQPGHVYFAPDGYHLELDKNRCFKFTEKSSAEELCPSINHLFVSMAAVYGGRAAGVLLSGMGMDGAIGMKSIHFAGGITIAQDEESSIIFSMPKAAINASAVNFILPVDQIAQKIVEMTSLSKRKDKSL